MYSIYILRGQGGGGWSSWYVGCHDNGLAMVIFSLVTEADAAVLFSPVCIYHLVSAIV